MGSACVTCGYWTCPRWVPLGVSPGRVFESYWNGSIESYLVEKALATAEQNGRSESRNLGQNLPECRARYFWRNPLLTH